MSISKTEKWTLGEDQNMAMSATQSPNRRRPGVMQVARPPHPGVRLACGLLLSALIHAGVFSLPVPLMGMPFAFFSQPAPPMTMIEFTLEDSPPPGEEPARPADKDLQQLQNFHDAVVERADALEQTLLAGLDRQAEEEAARQQRVTALEEAQRDLSQHVTELREHMSELTTERSELSARLAAERARVAELERQLREQTRAKEEAISGVKGAYDRLVAALKGEISQKEIALHQVKEKLVVTILDRVLFPSGKATLTPAGRRVIEKVGAILAKVSDRRILIEGHTDNVPIGPALRRQFPSNWELSTARATEVVKYLISETKLPPHLLSAVGRADTAPVASNENEEGRRQNRRIEIILLPPEGVLQSVATS